MAKLTIDIPDRWVNQATASGELLEVVVLEALERYLAHRTAAKPLAQTRTWQLCGRFSLAEVSQPIITNEAEHIDDVLY